MHLDEAAVAAMYQEGLTTAEIGRRVGCHRPTVVRLLRKAGVYEKGRRRARAAGAGEDAPPQADPASVPKATARRRKA